MKHGWQAIPAALAVTTLLEPARADTEAPPLPGTTALDWEGADFSERILDGAHAFTEAEIGKAATRISAFPRDPEERKKWIAASRESLARKLGVVDNRPTVRAEFFRDSALSFEGIPPTSRISEGPGFEVHEVRWSVLPGFSAEGLYTTPVFTGVLPSTPPAVIVLPDAGETPEDILGLNANLGGNRQLALRFASAGFRVVIPATLGRGLYAGPGKGDPRVEKSRISRREWIYRQSFQMGRHPLGYEIQAALAATDWLIEKGLADSVTVAGYGEGGRAALYAAALDPRIDNAFVSGAFAPRDSAWSEPIDRNLFGLLEGHGDAEVAALVFPRPLLVEHTAFPEVTDRKGTLQTPPPNDVKREFERIAEVLGTFSTPPGFLFHETESGARGDYPAVVAFLQAIGIEREVSRVPPVALLIDERNSFDPVPREERLLDGMQRHVQLLVDDSENVRREGFFYRAEPGLRPGRWSVEKSHPVLPHENFSRIAGEMRETLHEDVIGRFDEELLPPRTRSRRILETEQWTAWDVVLDVYPGFEAWGVLVLPKGIRKGERRPVVVCQHGRNGIPRDVIDAGKPAYNDFAARLAERGFITFAPFNLYRGEDRYRWLDRKANQVGCTLFSFIAASHRQYLDWLKALPEVDPDRIAFYGLSYGGETAVRIPAVLEDYCLSICSGDFNQWTRKVADPEFPGSFVKTIEWEMPYWNMGNTFDYGELAGLVFPRPFFVERGHHDRVSQDEWVAYEYARVRRLYSAFGMPERTGIEFFRGGHSIHGVGTFEFLHRHLEWPAP